MLVLVLVFVAVAKFSSIRCFHHWKLSYLWDVLDFHVGKLGLHQMLFLTGAAGEAMAYDIL